jgi:hypothetical protein
MTVETAMLRSGGACSQGRTAALARTGREPGVASRSCPLRLITTTSPGARAWVLKKYAVKASRFAGRSLSACCSYSRSSVPMLEAATDW